MGTNSSDPTKAKDVVAACEGFADYRYFAPHSRVIDKCAAVIAGVDTPYTVMIPDDDITFPHAINAALDALRENNDYVAAHGYPLRLGCTWRNKVYSKEDRIYSMSIMY